jgi:HPt (histidine-containing phosphotransfer) domain-containing protein
MAVDPEFDELKREFLTEAEEKVREIESALATGRDRESLDRLTYLAHQLKGSGGSYGFQRISADAADLERAVEQIVAGAGHDGIENEIRDYVESLGKEIGRRKRELG